MSVYSVYEPEREPPELMERAERLVFVKQGFSWPALLVPVFWLIYQRMWLELALFLALFVALGLAFDASDASEALLGWLSLGIVVLFAFEANDLRCASLERRGYRLAGFATGSHRDEAELAFFRDWTPRQQQGGEREERVRAPSGEARLFAGSRSSSGESEEVIGLFPRP